MRERVRKEKTARPEPLAAARQTAPVQSPTIVPPDRDVPSGQPLDLRTQAQMSSQLGHDFRDVRVHNDAAANEAANALGANAFTVANGIFFGAGRFAPGSRTTERLLSHELTHIVQQAQAGPGDANRLSRRDDPSEREAERASSAVLSGQPFSVSAAPQAAIARDESGGVITLPEVTVVGDERAGLAHQLGVEEGKQGFPTHRHELQGEVTLLVAYDEGFAEGVNAPGPKFEPEANVPQPAAGSLSNEDFERDKREAEERELEQKAQEERMEFIKELSQEIVE